METYLNMGYEYVCTCLADAKKLKEAAGMKGEAAEIFSSCSESGSNNKVAQEQAKAAKEAAKKAAAAAALALAARNKIIADTVTAMKAITNSGCDALGTAANVEKCYTAVAKYSNDYKKVLASKKAAVEGSGGQTSTKNKTQKDALINAESTWAGIAKGGLYFKTANTAYADRFEADGRLAISCRT